MSRSTSNTVVLALVLLAAGAARAGPETETRFLGNHHDSPVFYETQPVPYFLESNAELLHQNRLKLWHFPAVDMSGWDWQTGGIDDMSWWIQVEELRFLLPLLATGREEDLELAREWFRSWYESDNSGEKNNRARWREPMSAAYRGMVLVYFLKIEELREELDTEMVTILRDALITHQEYLVEPGHFNADSNHGLVEAFGLLEITRTFPNTEYEELGLDRLLKMCGRSISVLGTHKEHSPPYHFAFLNWIDRFSTYLSRQKYLDSAKVDRIVEYAVAMREAAYYMMDHDGTIPEIGDADSMNVSFRYPAYLHVGDPDAPAVFFDPEAGYAVHKDRERYVAFTIQNVTPELPYHYHGDALAVYYRCGGETILGDPGKYEYTRSQTRRYFTSMSSHNTVVPTRRLNSGISSLMASAPAYELYGEDTRYKAALDYRAEFRVHRSVVVPGGGDGIAVVDRFENSPSPNAPRPEKVRRENRARFDERKPRPADRRRGPENRRNAPSAAAIADSAGGRDPQRPLWRKDATIVWNFGYDVVSARREETGDGSRLAYLLETRSGRRYRFSVSLSDTATAAPAVTPSLFRGQKSPMRGWYSPKMFTMRPSYMLMIDVALTGPVTVTTRVDRLEKKYFPGLRILIKGY